MSIFPEWDLQEELRLGQMEMSLGHFQIALTNSYSLLDRTVILG
jgi:hypothetical protein